MTEPHQRHLDEGQRTRHTPPPARRWAPLLVAVVALALLGAADTATRHIFINGTLADGLVNVSLEHCSVKLDAAGNVHVISPGYRVLRDKKGQVRLDGSSDFGGATTPASMRPGTRHVLVYEPNPRVPYTFEVFLNGKLFRKVALADDAFTVDITKRLHVGDNALRIVAEPSGSAVGEMSDVARLSIMRGQEREDGAFVAEPRPVWELVRSGVDRNKIDRTTTITVE